MVAQQQQLKRISSSKKVYPVTKGLKSPETAKQYDWHFKTWLKWLGDKYSKEITDEMIVYDWDVKQLTDDVIEYLDEYMNKQRHRKRSTINSAMAAFLHFCEVNDKWDINRRKIAMFVPEDEDHHEDRPYSRTEIQKLIEVSDKRFKVVFLLLANGMRVGAIHQLNIGDLIAWPLPAEGEGNEKPQKVYQIWVYNRSRKGRYYTFVTPETAQKIDDYLEFRKKEAREDVTKEDSPLIRDQFNISYPRRYNEISIPKRLSQSSLEKTIDRTVIRSGIRKAVSGKVMLTHGFRKFAITTMAEEGVDFGVREYLVGHKASRGLDNSYVLSKPEVRLVEWSKACNALTIEDDSYHLQQQLKLYKDKYAKQFDEQARQLKEQAQMIEKLKDDYLDLYQDREATKHKIYDRDSRRMGFYDAELKPVAEGKKKDISKEQWLKENRL